MRVNGRTKPKGEMKVTERGGAPPLAVFSSAEPFPWG